MEPMQYIHYRLYNMYRRSNISEVKGDHVAPQYKMMVLSLQLNMPRLRERRYKKRIKWLQLKEETTRLEFKINVLERINKMLLGGGKRMRK